MMSLFRYTHVEIEKKINLANLKKNLVLATIVPTDEDETTT